MEEGRERQVVKSRRGWDWKRRGFAAAAVRPGLSVSTYLSSWGEASQTRLLPRVGTNIHITAHNNKMTILSHNTVEMHMGCCFNAQLQEDSRPPSGSHQACLTPNTCLAFSWLGHITIKITCVSQLCVPIQGMWHNSLMHTPNDLLLFRIYHKLYSTVCKGIDLERVQRVSCYLRNGQVFKLFGFVTSPTHLIQTTQTTAFRSSASHSLLLWAWLPPFFIRFQDESPQQSLTGLPLSPS